jgi:(5-formylfuran-3-yl)methyl phosphate synthase
MKVLISIVSIEEAKIALLAKPDILDIKNPAEGSLGAQFPWVLTEIVNDVKGPGILCSATLGDLTYKPGTAALAAFGAASCGVGYIKAGLHGVSNYSEGLNMMNAIVQAVRMVNTNIIVVASGYADYKRFNGLAYKDLIKIAVASASDIVMVDTAIKDGKNLMDAMSYAEIKEFIDLAHDAGLQVALAGSIKKEHVEELARLNPDIVGIRGAVCQHADRNGNVDYKKIEDLMAYVNQL